MAYGDFKDLTRKTASDKILYDKAFNIAKNPKYDRYHCELASVVYKFFDKKKLLVVVLKMKISQTKNYLKNYTNQLLKNSRREKYPRLLQTIWGADLADMQLISKFNKEIGFLLCIIDIFRKYTWVITITNAFEKLLDESNHKPNKICVDKVIEFYNTSMKSWLEK